MSCPACGAPLPDGARFCPECGQRLVARPDERRLVTVLMADLVGYTSLAEAADPEQVKNLVDRCFERLVADITAFGGRLDKIVGDEIVAQFGAPVTHEDDAERAVRAALRMQGTIHEVGGETGTPLRLRVGVNTGEVLVGALRAGGDATVMGDVVNTASRLQAAAQPGEVVVGPATHSATRANVHYRPLGPLTIKGREEPVVAWVALEAITTPGRRHRPTPSPLVGRDAERAALDQLIGLAFDRSRALLVVLRGDAGLGKSRLAAEVAHAAADEHGARAIEGHCAPYGETDPWAPVGEMLRSACTIDAGATPATTQRRLLDAVTTALALPPESPEVERAVEGLRYVLEGHARPDADPGRTRELAVGSIQALLAGLASARPLVVVVADLHWADDVVLDLLDRLLERLRALPVVVLATSRPGIEARWRPKQGRQLVVELELDPLDDAATEQLVRALLRDAGDDTVRALAARSGGNPLFVEELAALVREERELTGAAPVAGLPATLHGLIAARIDALPEAERSLLDDFAVVGTSGPVDAALALSGQPDADELLDALASRDLLMVDGDEFRFKSELIRDVGYSTLTKAERARRHAALTPLLADGERVTELRAHHLATAAELVAELGAVPGVPSDIRDRALDALELASQRAAGVEHWIVAQRLCDRALSLLATDDPRAWPFLLGRARARNVQRDLGPAAEDALLVLEHARESGDTGSVARALTILAETRFYQGEYDEAEATYGEAVDCWRAVDDERGVAGALRGYGFMKLMTGHTNVAERLISEALASFRASGDRRGEAWALQNLAWISFTRGRATEAEHRLDESARRFEELGDWGGLGWALGLLAYVRYQQGRLDEAAELAERVLQEGRDLGERWALGIMQNLIANVALWRGRGEECVARSRDAAEVMHEIDDPWGGVQALGCGARALAMLGRFAESEALVADMEALAPRLPDPGMRAIPASVATAIAVELGDPARARAPLAAIQREVPNTDDLGPGGPDWYAFRALADLQDGRAEEARDLLAPVYGRVESDGPRAALGAVLALAHVAVGDPVAALDVVAELDAGESGTWADRIKWRWAAAFACAAHGRIDDARREIDLASAIAATTDMRVVHAIAALARARLLEAIGTPDAEAANTDARGLLAAVGIPATGWDTVFRVSLR